MSNSLVQVIEVCRRVGREAMTSTKVIDAVIDKLESSIRLIPQRESQTGDLLSSRIGGAPDLPVGEEWPRFSNTELGLRPEEFQRLAGKPYAFIAQIILADTRDCDIDVLLPSRGILQFYFFDIPFYDISGFYGHALVRYHPDHTSEFETATLPNDLPQQWSYRGVELTIHREWTASSPADLELDEAEIDDDDLYLWDTLDDEIEAVQGFGPWNAPRHRMLGHPQLLQSPGLADPTMLLLQVDSDAYDPDYPWPRTGIDVGRVFYLIDEMSLKAQRFEDAWAIWEFQ